jgi:hypothetical protein
VAVLKRLDSLARLVKANDTFVFYFSGHGFSRPGKRHYLGTVDTDPSTLETVELSTVSLSRLRQKMTKIAARTVIFVIDACRNDPEKGKGDTPNVLTGAFSKDLQLAAKSAAAGQAGSAVLFGCSEGQRAYEWDEQRQGAFSYFLVQGLRGAAADLKREVTVNSLGEYLQEQVGRWAAERNKTQVPDLEQQGAARIVLARTGSAPGTPIATTASLDPAALFQAFVRQNGKCDLGIASLAPMALVDGRQRVHVFPGFRFKDGRKLPASLPVRLSVALSDLDPDRVSVARDPRFGEPLYRVEARTATGAKRVVYAVRGKDDHRAELRLLFPGEDRARTAADMLRRLINEARTARN